MLFIGRSSFSGGSALFLFNFFGLSLCFRCPAGANPSCRSGSSLGGLLAIVLSFVLLKLALFKTFCYSLAKHFCNEGDRFCSIIICRNHIINVGGVATSINHCDYGTVEAVGFLDSVDLFLYVNYEEC